MAAKVVKRDPHITTKTLKLFNVLNVTFIDSISQKMSFCPNKLIWLLKFSSQINLICRPLKIPALIFSLLNFEHSCNVVETLVTFVNLFYKLYYWPKFLWKGCKIMQFLGTCGVGNTFCFPGIKHFLVGQFVFFVCSVLALLFHKQMKQAYFVMLFIIVIVEN